MTENIYEGLLVHRWKTKDLAKLFSVQMRRMKLEECLSPFEKLSKLRRFCASFLISPLEGLGSFRVLYHS